MENYKLNFSSAGISHIGTGRFNNEDNFQIGSYYKRNCQQNNDSFILKNTAFCRYVLFAVFDGMGGGEAGEYASLYAAEEFHSAHMRLSNNLLPEQVVCIVKDSFQSANNRILRSPLGILGTTGVVCILDRQNTAIKFLWAGDSRGYLFRNNSLLQITQDQSVAAAALKQGLYTKSDPQYTYDQKRLTGYIGRDAYCYNFMPLESSWIKVINNDQIFLLTDGIYVDLENYELQALLEKEKTDICEALVGAALNRNSQDDMSVVQIAIS